MLTFAVRQSDTARLRLYRSLTNPEDREAGRAAMAQSLVLVDLAELEAVVARVVREATAKEANPRALTNRQLQDAYSISDGTIKRLRRRGLPHYFIGDSPRYDANDVLAWLREHGSELQ